MALSRFVLPFSDVGSGIAPSAGAKLFFYETGTSTPKNTFTDSAGTTPNANPVIADANGVFGDIWIDGTYKVVLKDKNDVQKWEADPIVQSLSVGDSSFVKNVDTLASAIASTTLANGDILNIRERISTFGGGAVWDVVLASSVTLSPGQPTVGNIVACTGVPTLALVLRTNGVYDVRQFGAKADGIADDAAACKSAIDAAIAATLTGTGGIYGTPDNASGSAPLVRFPAGVYKIESSLTSNAGNASLNYLRIQGNNATIVPSAGVILFGGVGFDVKFEGLDVRGGAAAISIKTGNADSDVITINDCSFLEQTDAHVISDSTSNSTILTINRTKMIQRLSGGQTVRLPTCDYAIIRDSWIKTNSIVAFTVGESPAPSSPAKLMIENCLGVPGPITAGTGGRWADVYGEFHATKFRFGGEDGGAPALRFLGDGVGGVSITNSSAFSARDFIEFYGLPNFLYVNNVNGLTDIDGLFFNTSLTNEQFRKFAEESDVSFDNVQPAGFGGFPFMDSDLYNLQTKLGIWIIMSKLLNKGQWQYHGKTRRLEAGKLLASFEQQATGWAISVTNMTAAGAPDPYAVQARTFTATADNADFSYTNNTYLNPSSLTANSTYTHVVVFDSTIAGNGAIKVRVTIGGTVRYIMLTGGRQVVSIPFVYVNNTAAPVTNMDRLVYRAVNLPNGSVVEIGRQMLIEGFVDYDEEVAVVTGTAAPGAIPSVTNQSSSYFRGDLLYLTNVSAGGHIGQVNTLEGNPGTWKTYGSVTA